MKAKPRTNCEFCPRRMTGFIRGSESRAIYRCCSLCFHLLKRSNNPWPRADDHTNECHTRAFMRKGRLKG